MNKRKDGSFFKESETFKNGNCGSGKTQHRDAMNEFIGKLDTAEERIRELKDRRKYPD